MTNKLLVQKAVKKRGKEILALLKTKLSYTVINDQVTKKVNFTKTRNFSNSLYSKGGKYRFPYNYTNSSTILQWALYFDNIYDLLLNVDFENELNIYASKQNLEENEVQYLYSYDEIENNTLSNSLFAKSGLSQEKYFQTLLISNWSYEHFIISAIYYNLETIDSMYVEKNIFSEKNVLENDEFLELKKFTNSAPLFFLNSIYGKNLFTAIKNTNHFDLYPNCWLSGIVGVLKYYGKRQLGPFEDQNRLNFYENMIGRFSKNFNNIKYYLIAFDSFIPDQVITVVSHYSCDTKSIHILCFILEKYENIFQKLEPNKKEYSDYVLDCFIKNELT